MSGLPPAAAALALSILGLSTYLPAAYKRGVCDGGTNWTTFSIIRIQNPTTNNASDVNIYYYNRNGTLATWELKHCGWHSANSPHPC